jgi:hypothetical protein
VRHLHAGHHELHFVTPRVELVSGKSLNIHPPGRVSQALFDTFRSMVNAEYGLADPDDPARSQVVSLPNHLAKLRAAEKRTGTKARKEDIREAIAEAVRREVEAGRVRDQAGVVRYLQGAGFTITRTGEDYVTVLDPESGQRIRLKGGLYSKKHFNARETEAQGVRYGVPDPARAAEHAATLERMTEARAVFHRKRYGVPEQDGAQQREAVQADRQPPRGALEPLREYLTRHLGAEALHPTWNARRQRTRSASHERREDSYDRDGTAIARRRSTFGATLQRAGHRFAGALAELDRASGRLERASRGVTASAAAIDPWLERQWWEHYYGHDQEAERWYQGPDRGR